MSSMLIDFILLKMDYWLSQSEDKSVVIKKGEFIDFMQSIQKYTSGNLCTENLENSPICCSTSKGRYSHSVLESVKLEPDVCYDGTQAALQNSSIKSKHGFEAESEPHLMEKFNSCFEEDKENCDNHKDMTPQDHEIKQEKKDYTEVEAIVEKWNDCGQLNGGNNHHCDQCQFAASECVTLKDIGVSMMENKQDTDYQQIALEDDLLVTEAKGTSELASKVAAPPILPCEEVIENDINNQSEKYMIDTVDCSSDENSDHISLIEDNSCSDVQLISVDHQEDDLAEETFASASNVAVSGIHSTRQSKRRRLEPNNNLDNPYSPQFSDSTENDIFHDNIELIVIDEEKDSSSSLKEKLQSALPGNLLDDQTNRDSSRCSSEGVRRNPPRRARPSHLSSTNADLGIVSGHCDTVQNRSKCQSINAVIADNKAVFTPDSSDDNERLEKQFRRHLIYKQDRKKRRRLAKECDKNAEKSTEKETSGKKKNDKHLRTIVCPERMCKKKFINNSGLDSHIAATHLVPAYWLKCAVCEKTFNTRNQWMKHRRKAHKAIMYPHLDKLWEIIESKSRRRRNVIS